MLKLFSFGKINTGILVTLLVLIALGSSYFFIYVPNNERVVQERRFRCLRKIDLSLRNKIQASEIQIKALINSYYKYSSQKNAAELKKLRKYITQHPKDNYTLLLPEQANTYFGNNSQLTLIADDTSGNKYYIAVSSHITLLVTRPVFNKGTNSSSNKKIASPLTIGMQFESNQFIQPLLLRDVFDYFIVFINKDKIYEDFPTGLNYADPDSLLTVKNKITSPGVRSIQIGETDYKVFSHPAFSYTNTKWIITGLLKNSNYQKEKNKLPVWVMLLLMTTAIVMLVSLPWIKLYHMGNKDRLTINDGIASVLVSILLMSFLFFVFFKYRIDIKTDRLFYHTYKSKKGVFYNREEYSIESLSSKVTEAFKGEINQAYNLLDTFKAHTPKTDTSVFLLGAGKSNYDNLFNKNKQNLKVKQIYWLDDYGSERSNMTVDSNNAPKSHYETRSYFTQAGSFTVGKHRFFLDQIFSYTDGSFRSVISEKTGPKSVIATSFVMKSLDKVVMPDGYQFAIISGGGWVLYHSKDNRNLVDQLQNDFVNRKELVSSLAARSETTFKTEYYGKPYNVKIKPIPDLPYYTVIFEDIEYNDTRDTEAYIFTLSMLFGMLVFLCIKYCILFFVSSRRSFLKKQHFDTSWIGPRRSCHHQYNLATIVNLVIIISLIVFFYRSSFLAYIYLLVVSVIFTSLFLNIIFAIKYKETDNYKCRFKIRTAFWLFILILLINIPARYNLDQGCKKILFLYELISVLIFPAIYFLGSKLLQSLAKIKNGFTWTFTHSYALMITTRLIVSSGIPVAFFFIYSFNYEQNLDIRYRQYNFAKNLAKKGVLPVKPYAMSKRLDSIKNNLIYTSGVYYDGMLISDITLDTGKGVSDSLKRISSYSDEDVLTTQILDAFRLSNTDIEQQSSYFNMSSVGNAAFFNKLNRHNNDRSPIQTFYKMDSLKYLKVASLPYIDYETPHIRFWILFLIALIIFYQIVHLITKKLFAINLPSTQGWGQIDTGLVQNNQLNHLLLMIGSPGSNTFQKLCLDIKAKRLRSKNQEILSIDNKGTSRSGVFVADMMTISVANGESDFRWMQHRKEALSGHGLVIINHFEYNIKDNLANKIKLDLIEDLIEKNISKVIIISTMHPLIFLDSFSEYQQNTMSESERARWHSLLGNFRVVIDNLVGSDIPEDIKMPEQAIMEETQFSPFLHRLQPISRQYLDKQVKDSSANERVKDEITDSLIFKVQLTSQYFYADIWQSLTWEEKFLLYDLAEDGLVNSYDDFNLTMLICKKLIKRRDGTLTLFNKGFRNFILTSIEKREMDHIKQQIKDNGKWGNLKTPLNLAILAILAFLFASQQEAYSRIITYVAAFSAGVPTIFKVFSMFGPAGKASKAD